MARSRACASLMFCILTFGFKAEVDWAPEGCRFRLQFQMDESEGGKSSIKTELWEARWYSGSRANTIMHHQSARSRITGQLGLRSCLSEIFFSGAPSVSFMDQWKWSKAKD